MDEKFIALETVTGICGEIATPPVVRTLVFDNKYNAQSCAAKWFAEAVEKERKTGLVMAEYNELANTSRVYGDLTLHVIWWGKVETEKC